MLVISTTLSISHVGKLLRKVSVLYKYPTIRCKNQLKGQQTLTLSARK
ncbi:hypothetical protein THF5G08_60172 [Vibrio jasicida]|nr:hypothetical protein THF5G08_60172 [Vibrio jasicida]